MSRRSLIGAAALLALVLAACGGSSGPSLSAFKTGFAADKAQFRTLGTDLGAAIEGAGAKSDSALATEFDALSARATQQSAALGKLDPPAKYKAELGRLTSGFRAIASDLQAIATAASAHNAQAARRATTTLVQNAAKIKASDDVLTAALGLPKTS